MRQDLNQQESRQFKVNQPGTIVMLEEFINEDLENADGENIGVVRELMADMNNGHIAYAVVSPLGTGSDTVVPFDRIVVREKGGDKTQIIARVTADKLKNAPSWKRGDYSDMTSNAWNERVHRYYDAEPYYVIYGYVITPAEERTSEAPRADRQDFASGPIRSFSGEVKSVRYEATGPGMDRPGLQITLLSYAKDEYDRSVKPPQHESASHRRAEADEEEGEDQRLTVNVAPLSYLQSKGADIEEGDDIRVRGFLTQHGGMTTLVATEIEVDGRRIQLRDRQGHPRW